MGPVDDLPGAARVMASERGLITGIFVRRGGSRDRARDSSRRKGGSGQVEKAKGVVWPEEERSNCRQGENPVTEGPWMPLACRLYPKEILPEPLLQARLWSRC